MREIDAVGINTQMGVILYTCALDINFIYNEMCEEG